MNTGKKKLRQEYKERPVIGGVFALRNSRTGKQLLGATQDMAGRRNRFYFARQAGVADIPKIKEDWQKYGADSFSFEVIEELEKKQEQSAQAFAEDTRVLLAIWKEKFPETSLY